MRLIRRAALAATFVSTFSMLSAQTQSAHAQAGVEDYPNRPVRLVIPFPAGGPSDVLGRILGQHISEQWGKQIVIENRAGANSAIAAQAVARSAPDGYTWLMAMDMTLVLNVMKTTGVGYKVEDFALVSLTALNTSILVVPANGPKTVEELIAKGRANNGKLNYGAGIIPTRLAGFLFTKLSGFEAAFVPYKGSPDVVVGLLDGSIDFAVDGIAPHLNLIKDGRLRALAKMNNRPLAAFPDLKPLHSFPGLSGIGEMSTWQSIIVPAGTPQGIITKIHKVIVAATEDPVVRQKLGVLGMYPIHNTPEEFAKLVKEELLRWGPIVKDSGIVLD